MAWMRTHNKSTGTYIGKWWYNDQHFTFDEAHKHFKLLKTYQERYIDVAESKRYQMEELLCK